MVKLSQLTEYLDELLQIEDFPKDMSDNGLQVEGPEEVKKVAFAVDARMETFKKAVEAGAQLLIVHHGLFWGESIPVTGYHYRRLATLIKNGLGLYAAHLPLDAHPQFGHNFNIAKRLGLTETAEWCEYKGKEIGCAGIFDPPLTPEQLEKKLTELIKPHGGTLYRAGNGPSEIKKVGIVSGGAALDVFDAAEEGFDAFITGETNHIAAIYVDELNIHLFCLGHYASEVFGLLALSEHLREKFDLETVWIHAPTGL